MRQGGWGWGAAFVDVANSGRLDLVQSSGVDFPWEPTAAQYTHGGMFLWRNRGNGTFAPNSARDGGAHRARCGQGTRPHRLRPRRSHGPDRRTRRRGAGALPQRHAEQRPLDRCASHRHEVEPRRRSVRSSTRVPVDTGAGSTTARSPTSSVRASPTRTSDSDRRRWSTRSASTGRAVASRPSSTSLSTAATPSPRPRDAPLVCRRARGLGAPCRRRACRLLVVRRPRVAGGTFDHRGPDAEPRAARAVHARRGAGAARPHRSRCRGIGRARSGRAAHDRRGRRGRARHGRRGGVTPGRTEHARVGARGAARRQPRPRAGIPRPPPRSGPAIGWRRGSYPASARTGSSGRS